jgi:hypothetical protein
VSLITDREDVPEGKHSSQHYFVSTGVTELLKGMWLEVSVIGGEEPAMIMREELDPQIPGSSDSQIGRQRKNVGVHHETREAQRVSAATVIDDQQISDREVDTVQ